MNAKLIGSSILEVGQNEKGKTILKSVAIDLRLSENLEREDFIDADGNLSEVGLKAAQNCFIQGLVCIVHTKKMNGMEDAADAISDIVKEIQRGMDADVEITHLTVEEAEKDCN